VGHPAFSAAAAMLMLGMIGEYVGRMYLCMNNSPQYVIREVIGGKTGSERSGTES
jgi:undecaprenyl-phosphate 4-deoxy-4-formamido-L-arabinose transferase